MRNRPKDLVGKCGHCLTCVDIIVGETVRQVGVRKKEHMDAVRMGQCSRSAIAEHAHSYQRAHEIDWPSIQVIDQARIKTERKIREAFHIQVRKSSMNRAGGVERSQVWNAIL